jgi:hypothetical protein
MLTVDVTYYGTQSTGSVVTPLDASPDATADVSTTTTSIDADSGQLPPVILNPDNLEVEYDESRGAFVSEWSREITPVPDGVNREVVVTLDIGTDEPVTVVVERDDTGDGTVDTRSEEYDAGYGLVTSLTLDAVEESYYRVVFPDYARDDDVSAVRVALTWPNRDRLRDNWPLAGVDTEDGYVGDILDVYASLLYDLDARIDEEHDNRFLETANDGVLDSQATPLGLNRQDAELDSELRYRIGVEYAIGVSEGTLHSLEAVLVRLFEDPTTVSLDVKQDEPVLTVTDPQAQIDPTPYDTPTVERKIERTISSSYSVELTTT